MYFLLWIFIWIPTLESIDIDHAVYLSTTKVDFSDEGVQLTVKVFEDDMRDALRGFHGHLIDTTDVPTFHSEVESYFNQYLLLSIDSQPLRLILGQMTLVGDSYQILLQSAHTGGTQASVAADYLMELFPLQQNVIHVIHGDDQIYHIARKGNAPLIYVL
jgi:hypothetical protein